MLSGLSDVFGRRAVLLLSLLFFTAGTAAACSAHGIIQMLVGRVIQGVGGVSIHIYGSFVLNSQQG